MVKRKYGVFFEALALVVIVMIIGMYLGVRLEGKRVGVVEGYQIESEVALIDVLAYDSLIGSERASCEDLIKVNADLLDRIYEDATVLDDYEYSGKITDTIKDLHKKYDVLRTYLWIDAVKLKDRCGEEVNTVVYLYNYSTEDLAKRAEQNIWSKLLYEIKEEKKEKVVLIPIAADTDLRSLSAMVEEYNIEQLPVVIVNEKDVFRTLAKKEEVLAKLN